MKEKVTTELGDGDCHFIDSTAIATRLLGDSIGSNLFLLGFAWQRGLVPVSEEALAEAIVLNGVAVEFNKQAFLWGRRCADQPDKVLQLVSESSSEPQPLSPGKLVLDRERRLTEYQNANYAAQYRERLERVRQADPKSEEADSITVAVARNLYKLMAYKDEYEVARLYSDDAFLKKLEAQFEGDYELRFNLAPPLLSERDPATGHLKKREFGPWIMGAFRLLARFRTLRGSRLDIFGYTAERRQERADIEDYCELMDKVLTDLDADNYAVALELARLPAKLRGFGHVKDRNREQLAVRQGELLARLRGEAQASAVKIVEAA